MNHEKLSRAVVKNIYATAAPLLNALALIMWTKLYPELGFYYIVPDALIAGTILHYIDYGVVVPWFFHLEFFLGVSIQAEERPVLFC